jgi:hypothetical protein
MFTDGPGASMPNTTKPPMPEPEVFRDDWGSIVLWTYYTPEQLADRDAQWLAYAEAIAAERVREERERVVDIALIELDCNGQAGAIIQAIRARKD